MDAPWFDTLVAHAENISTEKNMNTTIKMIEDLFIFASYLLGIWIST